MHYLKLAPLTLALAAATCQADGKLTTSLGLDYSSGKYGSNVETTILSLPLAVKYETGAVTFKASLPWLSVKAPVGSSLGPDGRPVDGGSGARVTEEGMGDLVTSLTWAAYDNAQTGIAVDLIGKVKWGTADEKKGLGTGKNDVSAQADIYKTLGKTAIFATLGYKVYGDPSGIDFKNVGYGGLGVSHRLSDLTSGGLTWDYRPKVTTNGKPTNEITAFMTRKFSDATKMQFYLVKGLSDGSPDWGGGLVLSHAY